MSKLGNLKKKVEYARDIPRCASCAHHWGGGTVLVNSLPRVRPWICNKYGFTISPVAVCKSWEGKKTGEVLETPNAELSGPR